MGLLNVVVTISEYASGVNIQSHCHLGFVKYLLRAFFSHLLLLCKLSHSQKQNPDSLFEEEVEEEGDHPSSALVSLVPFPVSVESITAAANIKRKLSVDEYNRVAERRKKENDDEEPRCAVCLDKLEGRQEVRELLNCRHVYHRHCLDAWVEKGHLTCPICRARLLAGEDHLENGEVVPRDPWRSERMMYLFGEDVLF